MKSFLRIPFLLLGLLKPKSNNLTLKAMVKTIVDQIQQIMECLFASLMNAGYQGRSHLIWDLGDQDWKQVVLIGLLKDEPVFLYRCGDRPSLAPEHCCWRLMAEHPYYDNLSAKY